MLFSFKKGTPKKVSREIFSRYGRWLQAGPKSIINDDPYLEYAKTDLHKRISAQMSPGEALKLLRDATGLSQSELGAMLSKSTPVRAARISDWENGFRAISKPVAKKLASIFHVSVERFI
jgi:DNA-binding transcriptional regulator YiaG